MKIRNTNIETIILLLVLNSTSLSGQLLLSHNDYAHNTPLHCALKMNADIIEADIYLRNNTIVVCHDENEIEKAPTLLELYILPLKQYSKNELQGKMLMLDIKEGGLNIIERINDIRIEHFDLFQNIGILLSGNFDRGNLSTNPTYSKLLIDGRTNLINSQISTLKMPIISIKVNDITRWKGCKRITKNQAIKLKYIIDKVHLSGRKIRFWNVENKTQSWNVLRALGVDIIGVDNLDKYKKYQSNSLSLQ